MAKTKSKDLFKLKYSKTLTEFICDKICDGVTLAEVCDKYGPKGTGDVPEEKTLYRWQKKYPEFKEAIRDAYKTLLLKLIDEKLKLANRAMELSKILNKSTSIEDVLNDEIKVAKFELDAIKVKQRAIEFTLTRIAPKFVEELKDSAKITAVQLPPITIMNYSRSPELIEYDKNK